MSRLEDLLLESPVIGAIRHEQDLEIILNSKVLVVFILYGNIMSIENICSRLKKAGKTVLVHVDMIDGLRGDFAGLEFISKYASPYGVITTKISNIKYAKQLGLFTIQRIFIIDSLSLKTGIKSVQDIGPNAIEVMPGVASKIISSIQAQVKVPVIAGGLIDTKKDIIDSLGAGAIAISTTNNKLWNL